MGTQTAIYTDRRIQRDMQYVARHLKQTALLTLHEYAALSDRETDGQTDTHAHIDRHTDRNTRTYMYRERQRHTHGDALPFSFTNKIN